MTELLSHWQEAEQPPAAEAHAMQVAVGRFVQVMGDMKADDVGMTALRRLADGLATTPYQKQKQPLHVAGREATMRAVEGLLLWYREGDSSPSLSEGDTAASSAPGEASVSE